MGDKTQLLAILLAGRYHKPIPILLGILVATLLNHWISAYIGVLAGAAIDHNILRWILSALFLIFAVWMLIPDKAEEPRHLGKWGVFLTTVILFFLAEIGDKTQLATLALGANFQSVIWVTIGTTLGMVFTNALGVFFGSKLLKRIDMNWIRRFAALLFALFAIGVWFQW